MVENQIPRMAVWKAGHPGGRGHFPKELRPPMTRQTVDLKDSLKGHRKSSVR